MAGIVESLIVLGVLGALLCAAEWVDPLDGNPAARPRPGTRRDLAWFAIHSAYAPVTAVAAVAAVRTISHHGVFVAAIAHAPIALQFAGAVVVGELVAYWLHRAMHAVPALWRLHVVHHGAVDLRWWSTFRFHPVDGALAQVLPLLAMAVCGFGSSVVAGYVAVVFVVTLFAHADVWIPGRVVARCVVVPAFHRAHHEIGRDNTNFALVLPILDRMFGTNRHDLEVRPCGTETPLPDGVLRQLRFGLQWRRAKPIASEVTLASPLTSSAVSGSASRRRATSAASR